MKLLSPQDPPPFLWHRRDGTSRAILLCDHAGRAFPQKLNHLGLEEMVLDKHVAWDIGIGATARSLSDFMDAPLILAQYSRLVIDCNRRLEDPTSIAQISDDIFIPGNRDLSIKDRQERAEEIFLPYHQALSQKIEEMRQSALLPFVISLHSFTPYMNGFARPWHIGVLWNEDDRIVKPLMHVLKNEKDLCIGDNEPYSGRDRHGYTMEFHAERHRLPHVLLEIRQDLIDNDEKARHWAARLHAIFGKVFEKVKM